MKPHSLQIFSYHLDDTKKLYHKITKKSTHIFVKWCFYRTFGETTKPKQTSTKIGSLLYIIRCICPHKDIFEKLLHRYHPNVVFPSEKDNKWIYISIIVTSNTDYLYDEDFEKILSAIKKIDENSVTETKVSTSSSNGVTPELKAFLDEYEAFWDEYVAFYKSYMDSLSSGDYLSMLSSYADMLEKLDEYEEKLDEMEKKLDEIDEDELSAEDYAYYLEVTTRIYMKMLEMYQ